MRVLVIGYGNPLRGDDGFGWRVAGRIGISGCQVVTCHQLTPELAETLSCVDLAIFIDATVERSKGRLTCARIESCAESQDKSRDESRLGRQDSLRHGLTHDVGIEDLLALGRKLYGRSPAACVISAVAEDFDCGEKLSPEVEGVVEPAVRLIEQLIVSYPRDLVLHSYKESLS